MKRSLLLGIVFCVVLTLSLNVSAQDIFQSSENGDIETVKALLKKDTMAVNAQNNDGNTPLHIAVLNGQIDMVEFLLAQNPDLEIKNEKSFTPLLCASWMFHRESRIDYRLIIESLLAHGAEANVTGDGGYNPLHWINHPSENSLADILELNALFISKDVDLDAQNIYGSTPLHYAVHIHPRAAQILIENDADVNIQDKQGRTPLFRISGFDHPEAAKTVRLLITNGAAINIPDNNGITAIERALASGRKDIADILIAYQDKSDIGKFPMHTGPYLGQTPPGKIPVKFPFDYMPSGYRLHSAPAFMPGGEEVYFSAMDFSVRFSEKIFFMKIVDGTWTSPQVAPFSGNTFDGSPSLSGDGKYLFFSSARKPDGKGMNETGERNIWYVEREGVEWGLPLQLKFRTPGWENGSDLSERGHLFFDSKDIYEIKFPPEEKDKAVKLGAAINSDFTELHPCVAPDERFLVFYSSRPEHHGSEGGDLYISFRNNDGTWKQARNLGELFNKGHLSTSFPRLSPDGRYLFFLKLVSIPWQVEVFWVSIEALDDLSR